MNGLKKWIFRYRNIFTYMSHNFFLENLHYIFTEVKIRYLIIWYLEFRDIFTVFYSLSWLQRCATWHTYYRILLSVVRSPFWKCCINPVVVQSFPFLNCVTLFQFWMSFENFGGKFPPRGDGSVNGDYVYRDPKRLSS